MQFRNLVLVIALGAVMTIGLIVALDSQAGFAHAQPAPAPTALTTDYNGVISDALGFIRTQQQPDGGIDTFGLGLGSSEGGTARALLALVASGHPASPMAHTTSGKTMIDYLETHAVTFTHDVSGTSSDHLFPQNAGLLLATAAAANAAPTGFGGMDLIGELTDTYHPATGAYSSTARGSYINGQADELNQAWAILGLGAAGQPVPVTATEWLIDRQAADGSWAAFGMSDPDTTALAVVALIGSGNVQPTDVAVQKALDYFSTTQLPSGGWRPWWDTDPANADTTGWVIQALVAAGYTPATGSWAGSPGPHDALLAQVQADGRIGGLYANAQSTAEAIFGLTEQPVFFLGRANRSLRALTWLNERQNSDGSWSFFGSPDPGASCDAVLAFASAGFDPHTVSATGSLSSAMDYLASVAPTYAYEFAKSAGKLALAVKAAGGDAHDFGGVDIVDVLANTWYSPTAGAFDNVDDSWDQSFAILGLAAAGETVPVSATQTLKDMQSPDDGSWVDAWGFSQIDSTGLALQALIASGVAPADPSIARGVAFLRSQQDAQGGWGNANSTALGIQGLLAAGEDLDANWLQDGRGPYEALMADQKIDGPFTSPWFGSTDNDYATLQAIPALLGVHYPTAQTLKPFQGVHRGPDPDRLVAAAPRAAWGNSVDVIVPFGSDVDGDGSVALGWRVHGDTTWTTGATAHRADGYYTATLPFTPVVAYDFRATFTDPDGVQYENAILDTVALTVTLENHTVYVPLAVKD